MGNILNILGGNKLIIETETNVTPELLPINTTPGKY